MNDIRYIFGEPIPIIQKKIIDKEEIEEEIGTLYPLNIIDYFKNTSLFNILQVTVNFYLQQIDKKEKEARKIIKEKFKDFDVICSDQQTLNSLIELLNLCFKENITNENITLENDLLKIYLSSGYCIDRNNYDYIKGQIIRMYGIKLPKQADNKELQKHFDRAYKHKSGESDQDFEDIITTIVAITGITPNKLKEMTIYQINAIISRINKVKQFDMNVSFICAGGSEDIKLEPYMAHIDLLEEVQISKKYSELSKQMGDMLKQ